MNPKLIIPLLAILVAITVPTVMAVSYTDSVKTSLSPNNPEIVRIGEMFTVQPHETTYMNVECPRSYEVTGGGWFYPGTDRLLVFSSYPFNENSWSVNVLNDQSIPVDVRVFAMCTNL